VQEFVSVKSRFIYEVSVVLQWWRNCISSRWNDWSPRNITYTCHLVQRLSRFVWYFTLLLNCVVMFL